MVNAFRYVLHIDTWLALGVLGLVVSALESIGTLPFRVPPMALPLARAVAAAYFFMVLRKAATGSLRLPLLRDYRDTWDTLIYPLMQLCAIGLVYWSALTLLAGIEGDFEAFLHRYQWRTLELFRRERWQVYLGLGLSLLYLPPALIAATLSRRLLRLFDPTYGWLFVARVPDAYARTFSAFCLLTVASFVVDSLAAALQQAVPIPLVAGVMRQILTLTIPLAQARVIGSFVHIHGPAMISSAGISSAGISPSGIPTLQRKSTSE
ncbi:MAG: hypothetical protein H6707_19270 [Deltaproteobacteria bacterium]|nr:hypothetical protein [Deltaproteobacteria bacterium]